MSWVTVVWSMIAAACLTLALVHGLVWWWRRAAWANALFALTAVFTGGLRGHGAVPDAVRRRRRSNSAWSCGWLHVPVWLLMLSLVGFVRLYFRAGRPWLAWTACGLRTLSLILNFVFTPQSHYREITALRHLPFLGESVAIAEGCAQSLDAGRPVESAAALPLHRGCHPRGLAPGRPAAGAGGGREHRILYLGRNGSGRVVHLGIVHAPILASVFYLGIIAAMSFELSHDMLRTAELAEELRESEQRMTLAVDTANFGIWIRDLSGDEFWATEKWRELLRFAPDEPLTMRRYLGRLHPEDRDAVLQAQIAGTGGRRQLRKGVSHSTSGRPAALDRLPGLLSSSMAKASRFASAAPPAIFTRAKLAEEALQ